jgi:Protein of unknown function (DUF2867)
VTFGRFAAAADYFANPSLNRTRYGRPPWPGLRYAVHCFTYGPRRPASTVRLAQTPGRMKQPPLLSQPPSDSAIRALLPGAQFYDVWVVEAGDPSLSPLSHFLKAAAQTPSWVNQLMGVRNWVVGLVGLKNLGSLPAVRSEETYEPGQRAGIFTLISNSESEVLLGDR